MKRRGEDIKKKKRRLQVSKAITRWHVSKLTKTLSKKAEGMEG